MRITLYRSLSPIREPSFAFSETIHVLRTHPVAEGRTLSFPIPRYPTSKLSRVPYCGSDILERLLGGRLQRTKKPRIQFLADISPTTGNSLGEPFPDRRRTRRRRCSENHNDQASPRCPELHYSGTCRRCHATTPPLVIPGAERERGRARVIGSAEVRWAYCSSRL